MTKNNELLFGYWKMTGMRFLNSEKTWENEKVFGGSSVFTSDGHVNTFTRTSELAFGYSGTFKITENEIITTVEVCSIEALEKKTIKRTIKQLTNDKLTLGMTDDATGRDYEIELMLVTRHF